jgi:hypothetical protein
MNKCEEEQTKLQARREAVAAKAAQRAQVEAQPKTTRPQSVKVDAPKVIDLLQDTLRNILYSKPIKQEDLPQITEFLKLDQGRRQFTRILRKTIKEVGRCWNLLTFFRLLPML